MGGMGQPRVFRRLAGLLAVLALTATGCSVLGGDDGGDAAPVAAPQNDPGLTELGRQLPEPIQQSRELVIGSDVTYAPLEFYDALAPDVLDRPAGEPEPPVRGIDSELAQLLGEQLGVRVRFENISFDELIPSLRRGEIDLIMSAMSITQERARLVSFIEYFQAGTAMLVPAGNPEGIASLEDLCGRTVAVQAATTQEQLIRTNEERCPGGQQPSVLALPSGTEAILELKAGQADACLTDFPVAAYNAKVSGQGEDFEVAGDQIQPGPYGIGVRKQDAALRDAVRNALAAAITGGRYDDVLQRWDVADGALKSARVYGA